MNTWCTTGARGVRVRVCVSWLGGRGALAAAHISCSHTAYFWCTATNGASTHAPVPMGRFVISHWYRTACESARPPPLTGRLRRRACVARDCRVIQEHKRNIPHRGLVHSAGARDDKLGAFGVRNAGAAVEQRAAVELHCFVSHESQILRAGARPHTRELGMARHKRQSTLAFARVSRARRRAATHLHEGPRDVLKHGTVHVLRRRVIRTLERWNTPIAVSHASMRPCVACVRLCVRGGGETSGSARAFTRAEDLTFGSPSPREMVATAKRGGHGGTGARDARGDEGSSITGGGDDSIRAKADLGSARRAGSRRENRACPSPSTHTYAHTHTHTLTRTHTHTHTHTHTRSRHREAHTHARTHTHAHTHTRSRHREAHTHARPHTA